MFAPVGFVAPTAVPCAHRLMYIAEQLGWAKLLMAGKAHLRHRFEQIRPSDNAVIAVASAAIILFGRLMGNRLLRDGFEFFVTL